MKCPKCKKGELQEYEFDSKIAICDNLDCGIFWTEKGMWYKSVLHKSVIKCKGEKDDIKQ